MEKRVELTIAVMRKNTVIYRNPADIFMFRSLGLLDCYLETLSSKKIVVKEGRLIDGVSGHTVREKRRIQRVGSEKGYLPVSRSSRWGRERDVVVMSQLASVLRVLADPESTIAERSSHFLDPG